MYASEQCRVIREMLVYLANVVGVYMPKNSGFHVRFTYVIILSLIWNVMFINGIYQSLNDAYKLLHALFPVTLIMAFTGRAINIVYRKSESLDKELHEKSEKFYQKYENNKNFKSLMTKRSQESSKYTKILIYAIFCVYNMPAMNSFMEFLFKGEKFLFVNNFLPYTDAQTNFGFWLNFILLVSMQPFCVISLVIFDAIFLFYGYQTVPRCDIICEKLKILAEKIHKSDENSIFDNTKQRNEIESFKIQLIEIINEHQDFNEYIKFFIYTTEISCFTTTIFNAISIGMSITLSFKVSVSIGISFGLLLILECFSSCYIGSKISSQKKRILDQLLYFPWQNLCQIDRKIFFQFICVAQATSEYEIPMIKKISMKKFKDIILTSYTYFNYCWNFMK
ncbi:hypothetical protein PVAND_014482 [Polypedilum vanderplanki]|uniref:Odorant receptor n=1 Tax=Polypedilum vanderplanki TaxID=319348 RepID=A0A9J6B9W9_POLVA|nr:hypothetical protein PVAND_014482 [Polypedilum vanderplanki]